MPSESDAQQAPAWPDERLGAPLGTQPTRDGWTWWPSRVRWRSYLVLGLSLDLLFLVVYGGANLINQGRSDHLQLYLPWEAGLPLVPAFIYVYFSIFLLFVLPPFALGVPSLRRLAGQLGLATLIAGAVFVAVPTTIGFVSPAHDLELPMPFLLITRFDLPYNLVPSLHVVYGTLTSLALLRPSPGWARVLLSVWLCLMCGSVVLVQQHHLLDVAGGLLLALLVRRFGETRSR